MQHLCLAKVLLLIREIDHHEGDSMSPEWRAKIKVCLYAAWYHFPPLF